MEETILWMFFFWFLKVFAKFYRVASENQRKDLCEALDQHTARFIDILRSRKGLLSDSSSLPVY